MYAQKVQGKRNALVVTVVAVLLGDIFAGGQNIPAQQRTWNAGDTKRTQMTESATQRMDLTDAFAGDITRCDEEIYRRICSR